MTIGKLMRVLVCFLAGMVAVWGLASIPGTASSPPVKLFDLGSHEHPISTESAEAQRYFNQGLNLTYGFNHGEAIRAFQQAARLDPNCAICYWGIAYALGPNINAPMVPDAVPQAWEALQRAIALSAQASESERAYIQALAKRYAPEPMDDRSRLDRAFAEAMGEVARRYPDDLDAATIQAEALMDTTPWSYWEPDGTPKPAVRELVAILESVLERDSDHPGANHLYIHAVEASLQPERAAAAADRLGQLATQAGHLLHMPSHIYLRVGRYHDASVANERAIAADESYAQGPDSQGFYLAVYYSHNLHFLSYSAAMEGRQATALDAARKLASSIPSEQAARIPILQWMVSTPLFVRARFGQWQAILEEPRPSEALAYSTAIWHYVRGLAFAAQGQQRPAIFELAAVREAAQSEAIAKMEVPFVYAASQIGLASRILAAEIFRLEGKRDRSIALLQEAVELQARLPYMEPPYWYFPVREFLGEALLDADRHAEAEAAYRTDLEQHPHSGWSLFGLLQSLRSQGKSAAARDIQAQFQQAWQHADVVLTASRF